MQQCLHATNSDVMHTILRAGEHGDVGSAKQGVSPIWFLRDQYQQEGKEIMCMQVKPAAQSEVYEEHAQPEQPHTQDDLRDSKHWEDLERRINITYCVGRSTQKNMQQRQFACKQLSKMQLVQQ